MDYFLIALQLIVALGVSKVKDPIKKVMPSLAVLAICAASVLLQPTS